ncbi:hypothetical protein DXT76_02700 [Halobacillus trueperi]|uniref:Uncharacterized protein n=1 Tax=Halobacillus trueperi TaxID=156205 RepID=A0A3D8VS96_9BACI|nr:hypothetical protein DXT76_02700 [Halobacillus trueperi]
MSRRNTLYAKIIEVTDKSMKVTDKNPKVTDKSTKATDKNTKLTDKSLKPTDMGNLYCSIKVFIRSHSFPTTLDAQHENESRLCRDHVLHNPAIYLNKN